MKLLKKQVRVKSRQIIINPKNQRLRSRIIINPKNQRPRKKRKRKKLKKKRKILRQTIMNRPREKWTKTTAKVQKILTIPTELLELVSIHILFFKLFKGAYFCHFLTTEKRLFWTTYHPRSFPNIYWMHPKEKLLLFQDVPQISIFSKIAFDKTFYCTHITFKLIYVPMYFCFKNLYSKGKKRAPSKCGFCKTLLLYECNSDQLPTF